MFILFEQENRWTESGSKKERRTMEREQILEQLQNGKREQRFQAEVSELT